MNEREMERILERSSDVDVKRSVSNCISLKISTSLALKRRPMNYINTTIHT